MTMTVYQEDGPMCHRCGKVLYRKRRTAARKAKMLDRRSANSRRVMKSGPIESYRYPVEDGWHIGHRRLMGPILPDGIVRIGVRDGDEIEDGTGQNQDE